VPAIEASRRQIIHDTHCRNVSVAERLFGQRTHGVGPRFHRVGAIGFAIDLNGTRLDWALAAQYFSEILLAVARHTGANADLALFR
jgi:hypothetical protein